MSTRQDRLLDLLEQWTEAEENGQPLSISQLCSESPELAADLQCHIAMHRRLDRLAGTDPPPGNGTSLSASRGPTNPAPVSEDATLPGPAGKPVVPGYEVLEELGRGGMGIVYKARQTHLNRIVALKMILSGEHATPEDRLRFLKEAEAIAAVNHPGVIQVYEFGTCDGLPFFALELCKAGSLAAHLAGAPLPPPDAARIVEQVAHAVHAAHQCGIVHRDLKPANILLQKTDEAPPDSTCRPLTSAFVPKVTDFGLAKRLRGADRLTRTNNVLGTLEYMAPEQAEGGKDVGPGADVYALGAILYECLTGRPPFRAATVWDTLAQVVRDDPVPPRQLNSRVPADLETITLKCLQKNKTSRYGSALELAEDLRRWGQGQPIRARPTGSVERAVKWARRRPTAAALLVVSFLGVASLLGLTIVAVDQWQRAVREKAQRTVAQVNALRDAAPAAVPAILKDLDANRDDVLPLLRELYAGGGDRGQRLRVALALLPVESERVGDELATSLLQAEDPGEVLLIRDALRPYAARWIGPLWTKGDDETTPPGARFRAWVALALFDPDSPRWLQAAPAVVDELLTVNALHLGSWVQALRPVRLSLLAPLKDVFRGRRLAERKDVAATVLADYAGDQPQVLAELLLDADVRQYATLKPVLNRHREVVSARMSRELSKAPDYWKDVPLDATWKEPAAELRLAVEQAEGLMQERFALCQALPPARLQAVTEGLRASGYRPLRVRPWGSGEEVRVALIWARDGGDWKLESALTPGEVVEHDAHWQKTGLLAADMAGYCTRQGDRYVVLWRRGPPGEKAIVYAGVPAEDLSAAIDGPMKTGLQPETLQGLVGVDGVLRCCGVWSRSPGRPEEWIMDWDRTEASYAGAATDALLIDVDVRQAATTLPYKEKWRASLHRAERALAKQPDLPLVRFNRGVAHFMLGEDEAALADFDALLAGGESPNSYRYRALIKARHGRLVEARADAEQFARLPDAGWLGWEVRARVGLHADEHQDRLEKVESALRAGQRDQAQLFSAARVLAEASALTRAWAAARAAGLVAAPSLAQVVTASATEEQARLEETRAMALLTQAMEQGHDNFAELEDDPALAPLRRHSEWLELLRRVGPRRYGFVSRMSPGREAAEVHGAAPEAHLERCRALAAKGWRPAAVSVAAIAGGRGPVAASVWHRPVLPVSEQEQRARQQATAAATLLHLGLPEPVWPLLRHTPEPAVRSYFMQMASMLGVSPRLLVQRLAKEKDASARQALIVTLGDYSDRELPVGVRGPLVQNLLDCYRNDPDPGVHGAIDWLLRHGTEGPTPRALDWGQQKALETLDQELASTAGEVDRGTLGRDWFVNGQGQTFSIVRGPIEFFMGSPPSEPDRLADERQHRRRIGRSYALAAKAVTVAQWQCFLKQSPQVHHHFSKQYSPEPGCPIIGVTGYQAMQYCNWLSQEEGIPKEQWCYPEKIEEGVVPCADYLKRTGYRLPTEAEWEHACRAGARTSRFYGPGPQQLGRYAWHLSNSQFRTWPVGQKRPNDLGLFDLHGNACCWCQSTADDYPRGRLIEDEEQVIAVTDKIGMIVRGDGFTSIEPVLRSAHRQWGPPSVPNDAYGLRLARTVGLPQQK